MPCATCGKTAEKLEQLRRLDWECSHVDCPTRRKAWSEGPSPRMWQPPPKTPDPVGDLFDKQEV